MNDKEFYEECAKIMKCDHVGEPFTHYRRTRWNHRKAGQGRFPDRGIIRCFGNTVHIALNNPPVHTIINSKLKALEYLAEHIANAALVEWKHT